MYPGMTWRRAALVMAPALLFVLAAACGGNGSTKTAATTTAAPPSGGAASNAITIVGKDNVFEPAAATVKANQETTLTFENKGTAIHNIHILNVKGKDGKDIMGQLIAGGKSETIKFTIEKPGVYNFQCDVHPAEMKGKLTVQ